MRHGKKRTKLGMMPSHRKATMRNMVRSLIKYQKIQTTVRRAKEARRLAEHLITLSKTDTVAARQRAYSVLTDRDLVTKLFKEISPLFKERKSGYTRIIPLGFRRGDGATMAILELTDKKLIEKLRKKKAKKAVSEEPKAEAPKKVKEVPTEGVKGAPAHREEAKAREEPKAKTIQKAKPTLAQEKKAEKAKVEDKRIGDKKKFLSNLRGFFHRKSDM